MSIANKLTYLNTTKGKIKDSINLTGAGITNEDTFRSYATKLRDGLVQVLNDNGETLYNNFPKVSGSGSSITLNDTLEAPMRNKIFKGNTLQNGEPTPDTPIDIQSVEGIQNITVSDGTNSQNYEVNLEGKNKWNVGDKSVGWGTSFADVKNLLNTLSAGTYTITLKFKVTQVVKEQASNNYGISFSNSNGNVDKRINTNANLSVDDEYKFTYTFTISSSKVGNFTNAYFYGFGTNADGRTAQSLMHDCQIELGDTATSYVPYRLPIKLYNGDYITGTPDNWSVVRNNGVIDSYNGETITTDYISTTGGLDTGATIVYELDTPTTTSITDTYLISQLNGLYNAKSYNGQTNISVSGNLPMILEVSALKDEI